MLRSLGFTRNERLSRFLRFLVEWRLEGRDGELKESVIGVEVFGQKPDYDPKLDSIVRTEARRLPERLSEYYNGAGAEAAVVIDLPKGGICAGCQARGGANSGGARPLSSFAASAQDMAIGRGVAHIGGCGGSYRLGPAEARSPSAVGQLASVRSLCSSPRFWNAARFKGRGGSGRAF